MGPVTEVETQKDPAVQLVHTVASVAEYWPVKHATGSTFLVAQNEPTGQLVHVVADANEYSPVRHATGATLCEEH